MNYIDTMFWLRLEILDIFNSSANKISIINLSNSCKHKSFQRVKWFPNFCLEEFLKFCLENFFIFLYISSFQFSFM